MRVAIITVFVALSLVLAGCAGSDAGRDPGEQDQTATPDNDAGAEPVNPGNGTDAAGNGTDDPLAGATATANGTATPGPGGGE